jgi:hypothetical protein
MSLIQDVDGWTGHVGISNIETSSSSAWLMFAAQSFNKLRDFTIIIIIVIIVNRGVASHICNLTRHPANVTRDPDHPPN